MNTAVMSEAQLRQHHAWKAAKERMAQPLRDRQRTEALENKLAAARHEADQAKRDVVRLLTEVRTQAEIIKKRDAQIKALREKVSRRMPRPVPYTHATIKAVLEEHQGVTWKDVISKNTTFPVRKARAACIVAVKEAFPTLSYPDLGVIFNRHHTSILNIIQKHGEQS